MKTAVSLLVCVLLSVVLFGQKEAYIKTGENTIHITTYGDGDPILIINGGPGMNSEGFRSLAAHFGQTHKAIIYDQRGTGESTIPVINSETITMDEMLGDIEIIREHLKIESWVVLGHSFGGMLASYYASKFPKRIKGLILSSSGGINMELFSRLNINSRLSEKEADSLSYWNSKIARGDTTYHTRLQRGKYLAPAYVYDRANIPVVAERLTQGNQTINRLVFRDLRRINFDCSQGLKALKVPVLIIQGREDIIDAQTAETALKTFPNATVVFLDRCGHYGWLDRPRQYFESIYRYLDRL